MTSGRGNAFLFRSFQQLPRLRIGPLKDVFLSWHGTLQGLLTRLLCCFWNYQEARTLLGMAGRYRRGGPKTPSKTADANLDRAFVENAVLHRSLIVKSQQSRTELVTTPDTSVGYEFRRLKTCVQTGIFECNHLCKCKSTCLNRVAQHPLR